MNAQIKGRATIQLLDKNKNVTHETVEENIITDAVERVALLSGRNFIKGLRSHGHNIFHYHASNITPLATELFGGIILFEGALPETATGIFPPYDAKPVGHAGAPYSGTNPYRGTYNTAESGPLYAGTQIVGYRHVWDFVTDRVNSTIGCICLTSRLGGNTGWKTKGLSNNTSDQSFFDTDSQIDTYLLSGPNTSNKIFSTQATGRGVALIPRLFSGSSANVLIYFDDSTGKSYSITNDGRIVRGIVSSDLTLGLETTVSQIEISDPAEIINTGSTYLGRRTFVQFDPELSEFTVVKPNSTGIIERKVYSETGSLLVTETVGLSGAALDSWTSPSVPPFYYKGKYYASIISNNIVYLGEFDNTGALIKTFDWSPMSSNQVYAAFIPELDRVILRGRSTGYQYEVLFNGITLECFKTADNASTIASRASTKNAVSPGYFSGLNESTGGQNYTPLYYKFQTNYLASINNLASPVTKTGSDMMKITYDILYED